MIKRILTGILCFSLLFTLTASVPDPNEGISTYGLFEVSEFN